MYHQKDWTTDCKHDKSVRTPSYVHHKSVVNKYNNLYYDIKCIFFDLKIEVRIMNHKIILLSPLSTKIIFSQKSMDQWLVWKINAYKVFLVKRRQQTESRTSWKKGCASSPSIICSTNQSRFQIKDCKTQEVEKENQNYIKNWNKEIKQK